MRPWRPTRDEIAAAEGRSIPDVTGPGLDVLFVGINPGLYSGATGHHFARPGNRFWRAIHEAGFTPRLLSPFEDGRLLDYRLGVTNLVERATATADLLADHELRAGALAVTAKVTEMRPKVVAFLGLSAYRVGFGRPNARVGPQAESIRSSRVWVLPNPSGLNAHYQLPALITAYAALRWTVPAPLPPV